MKKRRKHILLEGKALYLVIFISFIVSIILLLFISNNYFSQIEVLKYQHLKQLITLNRNTINKSLAKINQEFTSMAYSLENFEEGRIRTAAIKLKWGAYYTSSATSQWRDLSLTKTAFIGSYLNDKERIGLYLQDRGKYISVGGDTYLSGACYLPALGIRSVYIDGKPYKNKKLIYGSEKKSKKELPSIDPDFLKWISSAYNGDYSLNDTLGNISDLSDKKEITQSFRNRTLSYNALGELNLKNISLSGNIIIRSDSAIILDKSLKAESIIAIAPIIVVDDNFSGSVQLFARDSLLIDKHAALNYPSLVAVYNPEGTNAYCYISEDCKIAGGVLVKAEMEEGTSAGMHINKGAVIHGILYCSGGISHKGAVYGSMYVHKFVLKTPRGYYENHLLDAIVDPDKQMEDMLTPSIFNTDSKFGVIEWLN